VVVHHLGQGWGWGYGFHLRRAWTDGVTTVADARTAPTVVVPEHVTRRCATCLLRSASASTCSMRCTTDT